MKKIIIIFISLLLPVISFTQINKDGIPFIDHYTEDDIGNIGQIWAITQDNRGVMYFGCNYGLKTYNGEKWKSYNIPNSTIIRSLAVDESGLVYYGAESDFGVVLPDSTGELSFNSIFLNKYPGDSIDFGSVWKTLIVNDKIYFQSFEKVFYCDLPLKYDESGNLLNKLKNIVPDKSPFHLSFSVFDTYYLREWEKGLCKVKDGKTTLIPNGEQFAYLRVYIMLPFDDKKILIGTREAGFFIYDTSKNTNAVTPFELDDQDLIINSIIYSGTKLQDGTFAVGTFANGLIIFNKKGEITMHLNKNTGMPEQFIHSTFCNKDSKYPHLWFAYEDYGIFKADITGPFMQWNENTGLVGGTVSDLMRFNDVLYATMNNGLFCLNEKIDGSPRFEIIAEMEYAWDMEEFIVPNTGEKKLMMCSYNGIFEIFGTSVKLIAEIPRTYKLYQSKRDPSKLFIGFNQGFGYLQYINNSWSDFKPVDLKESFEIKSIIETEQFIALGTGKRGVLFLDDINSDEIIVIDSARGLPLEGQDFWLHNYKEKVIVTSGTGLYYIEDSVAKPFDVFGKQYTENKTGVSKFMEGDDAFWMSVYVTNLNDARHELIRFTDKEKLEKDSVFAKIIPQKTTYVICQDGNNVWIGNPKGLFKFNKEIIKNYSVEFNTLITKVSTGNDSLLFAGNFSQLVDGITQITMSQNIEDAPVLKYKNNKILFEWAAPFFEKENEIEYNFRLVGETEKWSKWDKKSDIRYTNLYEGDYTFEVKARNIYYTESSTAKFSFSVLPPWYRTIWAYISFFIIAVLLIIIIIKLYTKKLKRENEKLELTVKERTVEIRMQNEEITAQRDEIQAQKEVVEKAKDKIEIQQKSIMDSIHYASRIQEAVLPPDEYLQEILGDHFVLFKPRDIVSGDFYWATQKENKTVIIAADCTGHGVPGAFMSMLGISFLNEIINKEEVVQANIILNRLRENVKKSLRQTGKDNEAKDGMDIAICIIDMDEMKLQFAGAYNPLYLLRNGEISKVKADRMPIGIYLREKESFTNNIIDIQKGDYIYIFSDGYVDQFGGPSDNKIKSEKFKSLLLENHKKSPEEQKVALVKYLDEWMAYKDETGRVYKQVDDILIIGIEI